MANNIFRACNSYRLRSDMLVKKYYSGASQSIANEFWNITTNLRKRVVLTLKNAAGSLVASTTVKFAVFEYDAGTPNTIWMNPLNRGTYTTDVNGVLDVLYLGLGTTAYIAVIHPNTSPTESMIWAVTVT